MITVSGPKIQIDRLWNKPGIRDGVVFRLMQYVMRVDHKDKVLLHNVITGHLVILGCNETKALENLPCCYSPEMDSLIDNYYIVPEDCDEHSHVIGIRMLLRTLEDNKKNYGINHYTILPTTACNARCFYCFEQGVRPTTMTEQTANDVVEFIHNHFENHRVFIRWFGGEPTIATDRIDQICEGLHQYGIEFSSKITTNGYLLDENMVEKACLRWNLESAMISVDGTEERYNRVKAYVNANDSAYQRVMRNIGFFLAHGVHVSLRMNFDKQNYLEFKDLLIEAKNRYQDNELLDVYVHQINGHYPNVDSERIHGDERWFNEKILELNQLSRDSGFLHKKVDLPSLDYRWCIAARDDAVTILPNGELVSCPEQMGSEQFKGNVKQGITDTNLVSTWKQFANFKKCLDCIFFPECVKIVNCAGKDRCFYKLERLSQVRELVVKLADSSINPD